MESLYYFVSQYGYLAVFILLMVGIFGIPLPDEFLVAFIGYLIFQEEMQFWPAAFAVIGGGIVGISVNYVIGRTIGAGLCKRLAYFFPKKINHLQEVTDWLSQSGGLIIFLSYFLPGIRHWATVGAGVLKLSPITGGLCAFPAVIIWSLAFIWIGYHLGQEGAGLAQHLSPYLHVWSGAIILGVLLCYWYIKKKDRLRFRFPGRIIL